MGSAISFIADDGDKWQDICKVTKFSIPVKTVQKTIEPLPEPKFVAQEEGSAHARNRKKQRPVRAEKPSKATEVAKKLLAEGEVYLPQGEELKKKPVPKAQEKTPLRKVKTFRKAVQTESILEEKPQEEPNPFRTVKVGASKKKLQKNFQRTDKGFSAHKHKKGAPSKFFKRKKRK